MKYLFLVSLLLPHFSWAAPEDHIGDFVSFHIKYFGRDGAQTLQVLDYDAASDSYLVHAKLFMQGEIDEEGDEWFPSSRIATKEMGEEAVLKCDQAGGTLEKVQIASQTYDVCRRYFYKDTSYQLYGPFPFDGIAGFVSKDDTDVSGELLDFRWGK